MKRWELALQIFAVIASYLILSITFVSALEVRIFTSGGQEVSSNLLTFDDFIEKEITFPYLQNYQYINIKLSSKDQTHIIKKVYLYRCKNFSPTECIQKGVEPVVSVNTGNANAVFDETYRWDDVNTNNIAYFIIFVKLDVNGKEAWLGSFTKVTKIGIKQFSTESYNADRIDVYLKEGASSTNVKNYIENYYAIPSDSINFSVFQTIGGSSVSKIHDLYGTKDRIDPSGTNIPTFYQSLITGNIFNKSYSALDFVFPSDGKIANPITFYSITTGPPVTGGARLVVDNFSPQITTCFSSDVIKVSLHVENASNIGYFQSYYYMLDDVLASEGSITCSIINPNASIYSYECKIPVANFPVCNAPKTSSLKIYFNYAGGIKLSTDGIPITLQAPKPTLVVKSIIPNPFDCGIDTELTAKLQVLNPMENGKFYYSFDSANFRDLTCTGSPNAYECKIPEKNICELLQENLDLTFKVVYGEVEVLSLPSKLYVIFPPPSLGIDTITPQAVEAGKKTEVSVLLHVNYPDFITYSTNSFNYKYLDKPFVPINCTSEGSFSNIKYYRCSLTLDIPSNKKGIDTLTIRLDGYIGNTLKQLFANGFYEILLPPPKPSLTIASTSSPLKCIQDASLLVSAKVENIEGNPTTSYSVDGGKTYKSITCSSSANVYECFIPRDELCDLMKNALTIMLKFEYPSQALVSNPQNIYVELPEPHMQVYSINPDTFLKGEKTSATINLFVQYPKMVKENPIFLYSYLNKVNQKMTCQKTSSTAIRDFYECQNVQFEVPESYESDLLNVVFSIQDTNLLFPLKIPLINITATKPWLEIVSTTPSRIEVYQGNQTNASLYVTIHNAAENNLKHQVTLIPNAWVASGACFEENVEYDFTCNVIIKAGKTAPIGTNPVNVTLRASSDKKTYDLSDTINVYVLAEKARIDIQTVTPDTLYCQGQQQQNPSSVKITASAKNIASFTLLEERISFNGLEIGHEGAGRFCSQQGQGQTITCTIPTEKLLEKVTCGSGELAPGGGSHYYPLSIEFLVKSDSQQFTISGSYDISVVARPLQPYLEIVDNDVVGGVLQIPINCLGSQTIKLGDTGYVRLMFADLLHPEPKEDDITWSFVLDAHDEKGKLTKGMGVSPEANATICKLVNYQAMGTHRLEDYQCSFYIDKTLFQRCERGEGEIKITASSKSTGKKAEGLIKANIIRDESLYDIVVEVLSGPTSKIDCQIQGYGKNVPCSLASDSNQNVTLRIYNRNEKVPLADLNVYDFDVKFTGKMVDAGEKALGNCRKDSKESEKYICPFQIGPVIKLPYEVTEERDEYNPISLGSLNVIVYMKYADNLVTEKKSVLDGSVTIYPKKSFAMINAENTKQKMKKTFNNFQKIFGIITFVLAFCATCSTGNKLIDTVEGIVSHGEDCEKQLQQQSQGTKTDANTGDTSQNTGSGNTQSSHTQGQTQKSQQTTIECGKNTGWDWFGIIISSIFTGLAIYALWCKKSDLCVFDQEQEKSKITKSLENGIKYGFTICVLPRIIGEIGEWAAEGGSKTERFFGKVSSIGKGIGKICTYGLVYGAPILTSVLRFITSYMRFQMCMEMVQSSIETSAYTAGSIPNEGHQIQTGAQMSINMMNQMMSCFDEFSRALEKLTMDIVLITQYMNNIGGNKIERIIIYINNKLLSQTDSKNIENIQVCEGDTLMVVAEGFCKGGVSRVQIRMTSDDEKCTNLPHPTNVQCRYYIPLTWQSNYPSTRSYDDRMEIWYKFDNNKCKDGATVLIRVETDSQIKRSITVKYNPSSDECKSKTQSKT
jgi:hypothetical protein